MIFLPFAYSRGCEDPDDFAETFVGVIFGYCLIPPIYIDPNVLPWYLRIGDLARQIRKECLDIEDERGSVSAKEQFERVDDGDLNGSRGRPKVDR